MSDDLPEKRTPDKFTTPAAVLAALRVREHIAREQARFDALEGKPPPAALPAPPPAEVTDFYAAEKEREQRLGFMPSPLVQVTLPHSRVEGNVYTRTNGNLSLTLMSATGTLPYGSVPRVVILDLATESRRSGSRVVELGSITDWLRRLGFDAERGGKRSSMKAAKTQLWNLLSSTITTVRLGAVREVEPFSVGKARLWWDPVPGDERQREMFPSTITLSEGFHAELVEKGVPVDMDAIDKLRKSPMQIDLYCWLTARMFSLDRDLTVPWAALVAMFGAGYASELDFRKKLRASLKRVLEVYPEAKVGPADGGLLLTPSPTHVLPAKRRSR